MRNVAIVAFHVYPDAAVGAKRVSELANHLASDDWQLVVVSHRSSATDPSRHLHESITAILIEQPRPISLRVIERLKRLWPGRARSIEGSSPGRMSAPPRGPSGLIAKIEWHYHRIVGVLDPMKKWSIKVALQFLWNKDLSRAQVIVVSGPPWSPVLAATVVGVCWRRPVLFDLRDPWFERVGESREYTGFRRWADKVCEFFCMRVARTVTVTTEAFLRSLAQRYPQHAHKIFLIRNGYDESMVIASPAPVGKLAMLYAGTIYIGRNPFPLLQGLAWLLEQADVDRTRVRLKFVGDCRMWNGRLLSDITRELAIEDVVEIQGIVSGARIRELTTEANVIVNFAQGHPEQAPAKLYEQLVSNRFGLLFAETHSESANIASAFATITRLDDSPDQVVASLRRFYDELVVHERSPSVTEAASAHSRVRSNQRFEQVLLEMLPER